MVEFLISMYVLMCFLWAIFAGCMQRVVYPHNSGKSSLLINFLMNVTICPITMIVAIIKFDLYINKIKKDAIEESKEK